MGTQTLPRGPCRLQLKASRGENGNEKKHNRDRPSVTNRMERARLICARRVRRVRQRRMEGRLRASQIGSPPRPLNRLELLHLTD
jgi:hypothetical protein